MKQVLFCLFFFLSIALSGQRPDKITIIHTNDLHSRLAGYSPESAYSPLTINDDNTVGGFARIATIIKQGRDTGEGVTLVLDAGDFLMGTLFQGLEETTGFQLRLMKHMGYDAVAIGNHEFDFGPAKLSSIVSSASNRGPIPQLLLGNAVFDKNDSADDSLESLFDSGIISRTAVIVKEGIRIGVFSLLGKVADENAAFAPPVSFSNQVKSARKMVSQLRNENCDIIICLSHSGLEPGEDGGWEGEDVELAKKVEGIDIIISGHTHTTLNKPVVEGSTIIVQTGEYGKNVGKMTLKMEEGKILLEDYDLIPVNDLIEGDAEVNTMIEEQKKLVTSEILSTLGLRYDTKVAEAGYLLECNEQGDFIESNLGPFVADAIHYYINRHLPEGTDISMVAVGVIRDNIIPGVQGPADIFRIMSMGMGNDNIPGYPLAELYVSGRELKSILEILQVAYRSAPSNYCFYSGLRVESNPEKGLLRKIQKIDIVKSDGTSEQVDLKSKGGRLYSITANSYMLQFIGIIKKMSFGLINVVPKDINGNRITDMNTTVIDINPGIDGIQEGKEWLAILEYLSSMDDSDNDGIPDIDRKYKDPAKTFITIPGK